jgi:hypothetical protein
VATMHNNATSTVANREHDKSLSCNDLQFLAILVCRIGTIFNFRNRAVYVRILFVTLSSILMRAHATRNGRKNAATGQTLWRHNCLKSAAAALRN